MLIAGIGPKIQYLKVRESEMRLKLTRLGKAVCKGPLVDHGLLPIPWEINETRTIDDSLSHQLLAKYPGLFKQMRSEDRVFDKMKPTRDKEIQDKIHRPKGVK